eukprot:GHVT01070904.1.p1 GENE.GHVT01070904.1~~GHVT01070904.1.p1  ORF type:complete len:125 (-),score=29.00 GHVT01070904.1:620-994(-)
MVGSREDETEEADESVGSVTAPEDDEENVSSNSSCVGSVFDFSNVVYESENSETEQASWNGSRLGNVYEASVVGDAEEVNEADSQDNESLKLEDIDDGASSLDSACYTSSSAEGDDKEPCKHGP